MFEPPPVADASRANLARVFRVIAFIAGITAVLTFLMGYPARAAVVAVLSVGLWVAGNGLDEQRRWARWMGYVLGVAFLLHLSVMGLVVGGAILISLWRASKAGAFGPVQHR